MSTAMTAISSAAPTRSSFANKLCLEDDAFPRPAPFTGAAALNFRNQFAILDQSNASIAFTAGTIYGTVDRTFTDSTSQGVTLQVTGNAPLFGMANYFTAGFSVDASGIGFRSTSTLGRIFPDFDVAVDPVAGGLGQHHPRQRQYRLCAGQSGRHHQLLRLLCRGCAGPDRRADRDGGPARQCRRHRHPRPQRPGRRTERQPRLWPCQSAGGPDLQAQRRRLTFFGGYSEANRAPTPLELDCANPNLPCLLEGSLVADPPLAQVVSPTPIRRACAAMRDLGDGKLDWSVSLFRTDSDNDIVALASTIAGRGYFTNVPSTQRQGVDLSAHYTAPGLVGLCQLFLSGCDLSVHRHPGLAQQSERRCQRQCDGDAGQDAFRSIPPTRSAPAPMWM